MFVLMPRSTAPGDTTRVTRVRRSHPPADSHRLTCEIQASVWTAISPGKEVMSFESRDAS